jgi:four helix bundle protein
MGAEDLKKRTQAFGISIVKLIQALPNRSSTRILGQQLVRCGTSVGANFRAACRARSSPDFIAKLKIVEEECDESIYWLEMFRDTNVSMNSVQPLIAEANQILSIIVASIKTARRNLE